jgi:phage recombination protein Bet
MAKNEGERAPNPKAQEQGDGTHQPPAQPQQPAPPEGSENTPKGPPAEPPTQALTRREANVRIANATGFKPEEVAIVKAQVAKGTTDMELSYFLMQCRNLGLNPFNKEVWCYKDNVGNLLIFTGRDGFLSKAQKDPRYNGIRSGCIRENDEYSIDVPNGRVEHRIKGGLKQRGEVVGGYAFVFMVDRATGKPLETALVWAPFENFNKNRGPWKTNPDEMIVKCAEAHAIKKAMGFSGLEVEEDYYVNNGIATPFLPPNAPEELSEALQGKITLIRLALENYTGADHAAIQAECAARMRAHTMTEAFADQVLAKLSPKPDGHVEDVVAETVV